MRVMIRMIVPAIGIAARVASIIPRVRWRRTSGMSSQSLPRRILIHAIVRMPEIMMLLQRQNFFFFVVVFKFVGILPGMIVFLRIHSSPIMIGKRGHHGRRGCRSITAVDAAA